MNRGLVSRFFAATIIAACVLGARTATAQGGSLAGKVTDSEKGSPVAGAHIEVTSGLTTVGSATTGADGSYRVTGLVDGSYIVTAHLVAFAPYRAEGVTVRGATTHDFKMTATAAKMNPVVVTTGRGVPEKELDAPAAISVVTAEQLGQKPAATIADFLKNVPGVVVSTGGILQSNIVSRGFNNAFSGSMLNLQDYRYAGVPSLRVNVPALFTGTQDDIDRIEVLNGPASALYGPNAANGVLHVITKSPFDSKGTTLSVEGGNQSLFRGAFRNAGVMGDGKWGYKISGEYFTATDFKYNDPNEPATWPTDPTVPSNRAGKPLYRDFGIRRATGEGRLDYRPNDYTENIFTAGYTQLGDGIEVTSLFGGAQAKNWTYMNLQDRFKYKGFFAQVFYDGNNSGNNNALDQNGSYFIRTGIPVVDKSTVTVGQVQQTFDVNDWKFVGGLDYIGTKPRSEGTIFGRNEGSTDITETGAYLQGTHALTRKIDFVGAVRGDNTDRMTGVQFSPRLAFTYKVDDNNNLRFSFNRAFNSPASFEYFLDQVQSGGLPGFSLRAIGNPPKEGWLFNRSCDATVNSGICMHSPFVATGPTSAVVASPSTAFPGLMSQLLTIAQNIPDSRLGGAAAKAQLVGLIQQMQPILGSLQPTSAQTGNVLILNGAPVASTSVKDINPLTPSFNNTWEVGYKGIINERFRVAVDAWYQLRAVGDPISQLNPLVTADQTTLTAYLKAAITAALTPSAGAAVAAATAAQAAPPLGQFISQLPVGTLALNNSKLAPDQTIIATYTAATGTIDVRGIDVALDYQATDQWFLSATYSNQDKVVFPEIGGINPLMSNTPKNRATGNVKYTDDASGWSWDVGVRYMDTFPVNSGVLNSLGSPPNSAGVALYSDVPTQCLFDFSTSWRLPIQQKVTWGLSITNINDQKVPTFVGTAPIGRLIVTKLQYNF